MQISTTRQLQMPAQALNYLRVHSQEHLSKFKAQALVKASVMTFFRSRFPRDSLQSLIVFVFMSPYFLPATRDPLMQEKEPNN
jgi:hypothetical protein